MAVHDDDVYTWCVHVAFLFLHGTGFVILLSLQVEDEIGTTINGSLVAIQFWCATYRVVQDAQL